MKRITLLTIFITGSWAYLLAQSQNHPAFQSLPSADSIETWLATPAMKWGIGALIGLAVLGWAAFLVCSLPLFKQAFLNQISAERQPLHPGLHARFTSPRVSMDPDGLEGYFPQMQAADNSLEQNDVDDVQVDHPSPGSVR